MKFSCERDPILKEIANAYEIISYAFAISFSIGSRSQLNFIPSPY